ncbi:hypothetical protein U9M48_008922 [Paspalum notatum var. saurae]|uniref:Uncharacterized protein n=1 Tax=Paspalum notatum var. saurae TaxID=547442 RepID=A0AAQ3SQ50_PASNO
MKPILTVAIVRSPPLKALKKQISPPIAQSLPNNTQPPGGHSSAAVARCSPEPFYSSVLEPPRSAFSGEELCSDGIYNIVVYVTVPNREAVKKLAGSIISEKLAACVNIVPGIESVYLAMLNGCFSCSLSSIVLLNNNCDQQPIHYQVQSDAEELLIIKTRDSLLDALTEHVKANHEYDVPEVIALPIQGGSMKYLEWLKNSTKEN